MKALIEGLLNYSRLGKSRGVEPINLNHLLDDVKGNLAAAIKSKKAEIEVGKMPTIKCMKTEMMQLFQNLINNAIKYTAPDVRPKVRIDVEEQDEAWQFSVKDNGIGIPDNQQGKIFNMFSRLHGDGEYQGQGIGLAFCKKIVDLHGGSIWLESMLGQGSTFYFTISKKLKDDTAEIEHNPVG
jgi:light-regulated signal transduction histidine kinase (bacteriophytochrome)